LSMNCSIFSPGFTEEPNRCKASSSLMYFTIGCLLWTTLPR
jgi:hypothetical protein